ncbi:hypothetical protein VO71_19195 [Aeromonas salmonicida subsp. smithia]|nr:hypothetical protein VO71_19195 [Aeromonas salmonicida subsp. smithia]
MINWRSSYAFALHRDDNSRWSEAKLILGSFLVILLIGTIFLVQPSSHNGEVTFVNALFTATSAISVTGLGVVDTGTAFTLQGQVFLLILMEIGGLGQMTMTLLLIAMFSKRVGLRQQVLAKEALGQEGSVNIVGLVRRIVLFAFIAQLIGTAVVIYGNNCDFIKIVAIKGVVAQISQQIMISPAPSDRYTRGFLTGRPRVFSLFIALTYAITSPT